MPVTGVAGVTGFLAACSLRSRRCAAPKGSSTPRGGSPGRRPSSPISRATPTASRSRIPSHIRLDDKGVTFRCKDYRVDGPGKTWIKSMTLDGRQVHPPLLLHVLPNGSHRVRHYGLFAGAVRAHNIERVRQLLAAPKPPPERPPAKADETETPSPAHRRPVAAAEWSSSKRSNARAPRDRPRRTRSGSTPHDHVVALPALQHLSLLASCRAPDQEGDASRGRPALSKRRAPARPVHPRDRKGLAIVVPAANHPRHSPRRGTPALR